MGHGSLRFVPHTLPSVEQGCQFLGQSCQLPSTPRPGVLVRTWPYCQQHPTALCLLPNSDGRGSAVGPLGAHGPGLSAGQSSPTPILMLRCEECSQTSTQSPEQKCRSSTAMGQE